MPKKIIVSDLDGSLIDSQYSWKAAEDALKVIRQGDVPLVLCSSKTRAEMERYRRRLENRHPFVAENGGGMYIPTGYFPFPVGSDSEGDGYRIVSLGMPYEEIRKIFVMLRMQLGVAATGFGDLTTEQVAQTTGLPEEEAALAREREYGEPFLFEGPPDERLLRAIEAANLHWTQGRFYHIMGDHDKGRAVNLLRTLYERLYGTVQLIGLGDGLNDLPLLRAVDVPVLIRREDGSYDGRIDIPGLYRTNEMGPAGWNEAVLRFIDR